MKRITHRRICWPDPDATCLNGGCGYCNHYPFKSVKELRKWAEGKELHHRFTEGGKLYDALKELEYGLKNEFFNVRVRYSKEK